jgi:alginate O-acetyltransferase complex protein AlgI
MVFSSALFLFLFLPLVIAVHFAVPRRARNAVLLAASLWFYAWGSPGAIGVLLLSIGLNHLGGLLVDKYRDRPSGWWALVATVVANLALLGWYKYAGFAYENARFALDSLGFATSEWRAAPVLPAGISFFTFQAMSYVVDVYRRHTPVQRNPFDLALYVALFPQLVAGPIVRYADVAAEIRVRETSWGAFASGIDRFVVGLMKKLLLANTFAAVADGVFAIPDGDLTPAVAWLGVVCYTLQIYFDFSGYSDMAIGLGRMFGFTFLENFDHPYAARSLTEFWRRWHISLSTWFRDYVYIPLGGNRHGAWATGRNLLIVFLLCGLWHGAAWTFVAWGVFHGVFLILERGRFGRGLEWLPVAARHAYTLLLVMAGWTLFRSEDFAQALTFGRALCGLQTGNPLAYPLGMYLDGPLAALMALGVVAATPVPIALAARCREFAARTPVERRESLWLTTNVLRSGWHAAALAVAGVLLAASSYNPFIYFRF